MLHGMCVGAGLEINSAGLRPPGTEFDTPPLMCFRDIGMIKFTHL